MLWLFLFLVLAISLPKFAEAQCGISEALSRYDDDVGDSNRVIKFTVGFFKLPCP